MPARLPADGWLAAVDAAALGLCQLRRLRGDLPGPRPGLSLVGDDAREGMKSPSPRATARGLGFRPHPHRSSTRVGRAVPAGRGKDALLAERRLYPLPGLDEDTLGLADRLALADNFDAQLVVVGAALLQGGRAKLPTLRGGLDELI